MSDKKPQTTKNNVFSFKEYKIEATKHDVELMRNVMVPKGWENIPIVGALAYSIRIQYAIQGIDRGPLRKQIWKYNIIFVFSLLIYPYVVASLLTPWIVYAHTKISVNKTNELIISNNL